MKKSTTFIIAGIIILLLILSILLTTNMVKKSEKTLILLETNYGNITIELRNDMPITSANFKNLVEKGTYNGVIFHRIIPNFMIQGGDPTGTGYGDPKIAYIKDEFNGEQKNNRATLAMANAGPNTGSSQFFINLVDNNFLDNKHPVFGKVIQGMDVVDKIASVQTDRNDKPLKEVKIIQASVL
jgi:peptidylprolyl isomerase